MVEFQPNFVLDADFADLQFLVCSVVPSELASFHVDGLHAWLHAICLTGTHPAGKALGKQSTSLLAGLERPHDSFVQPKAPKNAVL